MKNKLDVVKITFTGIGTSIFKYNICNETLLKFERTAKLFYLPLEVAIFDGDFFKYLNDKSITCLDDLKDIGISGMLILSNMQIDIWCNSWRYYKIKNLSLENSNCLFPVYNINAQQYCFLKNQDKLISISETYIGLIMSFRIITNKFDMNKLTFNISDVELVEIAYSILTSMSYDGIVLQNHKSDNLITNRICTIE